MKQYAFTLIAMLVLLVSCSKPKPDTTPLHPSEPAVVPTSEEEITHLVETMVATGERDKAFTAEFMSLMNEASHLVAGNRDSVAYTPFNWPAGSVIEQVNISADSVTVDMAASACAYTLVMRHSSGRWCVDDVRWPGNAAPRDTERHSAQNYIDDAVNQLTTADAGYIVSSRIEPLVDYCKMHPDSAQWAVVDVQTAQNYLKQNRGYDQRLEQRILMVLGTLKNIK